MSAFVLGGVLLAVLAADAPEDAQRVVVGDAVVHVEIGPAEPSVPREVLLGWVEECAKTVAEYYGRFPVPRVNLFLVTGRPRKIGYGTTWDGEVPRIRLSVGSGTTRADLADDWVLTHEMVHLGFPDMPDGYEWIEEGLATYVEPIARVRAGRLGGARAWSDMVDGLPKGLPGQGDGGLDGTRAWGRTYWGGALFWLLADVEIRERTHGRRGLEDALRGILAAGGSIRQHWRPERAFKEGDRATGVPVLVRLHERLGKQGGREDLDALWKRLGVVRSGGEIDFDAGAPLAAIRQAITARRSSR